MSVLVSVCLCVRPSVSVCPSHIANFIHVHRYVLVIAIDIENLNFKKICRCSNVIGTSTSVVLNRANSLVYDTFLRYQILPCIINYSGQKSGVKNITLNVNP